MSLILIKLQCPLDAHSAIFVVKVDKSITYSVTAAEFPAAWLVLIIAFDL